MERSSKPGQPPGNWHDWPVQHCFLVNSELWLVSQCPS